LFYSSKRCLECRNVSTNARDEINFLPASTGTILSGRPRWIVLANVPILEDQYRHIDISICESNGFYLINGHLI
ncbi:MAG TPA: hypothetical protein VGH29_19210, partial [Candidatus Binataceae bacterium]